jgi:hypothetical protein
MNFINSILLFFAVLFLGPKMIAQFDSNQSNKVAFASKDDPYDSTILIRGGTFAMGMNQENIMGGCRAFDVGVCVVTFSTASTH